MQITEIKYKNILYTTEFSENWDEVFIHALGIAKQYNAKLTFLYVLNTELIDLMTFDVGLERKPSVDKKFTEAKDFTINVRKQIVKKLTDAFGKNVLNKINILVERGNPVKITLNVAEEYNCDLIVMGFQGKGTGEDTAKSNIVKKVLQRSKLPVLVVHNIKQNS